MLGASIFLLKNLEGKFISILLTVQQVEKVEFGVELEVELGVDQQVSIEEE